MKAGTVVEASVFVSYRRSDAPGYAGRLYDHLKPAFGHEHVFMDIDTLEFGKDFSVSITRALDDCHALLAVIGPSWLDVRNEKGNRRLDDPRDFVRKEILAALIRDDVLVIPVLVQGAEMPGPEELPAPLEPLAYRHALKISDDHWSYDMGRLTEAIQRAAEHESTSTLHDVKDLEEKLRQEMALEEKQKQEKALEERLRQEKALEEKQKQEKALEEKAKQERALEEKAKQERALEEKRRQAEEHEKRRREAEEKRKQEEERVPPRPPYLQPMWIGAAGVAVVLLAVLFISMRDSGGGGSTIPSGADVSNGRIAFLSDAGGTTELVSAEPDGSDAQPLTEDGADTLRPDWSPDGSKLVFASDREGDTDLWMINADGTGLEQLTSDSSRESAPDWSPDGLRIAFATDVTGNRDIWVLDLESRELTQLTDDPGHDDTPDWSRTDRIAFVSENEGELDIFSMNPEGGDVDQITSNDGPDFVPEWSPDGTLIAYRRAADIWTVQADGGGESNLTNSQEDDDHPAWSPDGELIAFDSLVDGNTDIRVMTSTGEDVRDLIATSDNEESPSWQAILE
ncbi:MAG: DPP IV N-terminal domain-containing protein [Actinomycetota bacterium]